MSKDNKIPPEELILRRSIDEGDVITAKTLLEALPEVALCYIRALPGTSLESCLCYAISAKAVSIFHLLLRCLQAHHPQVFQDRRYWRRDDVTVFHVAASNGLYGVFTALLASPLSLSLSPFALDSPSTTTSQLSFAGTCGCGALTHDHGIPQKPITFTSFTLKPLLHQAVAGGHLGIVAHVLADPRCDVNRENCQGMTALHWAVWRILSGELASLDVVKLLLRHGADVNHQTQAKKPSTNWMDFAEYFGASPLHLLLKASVYSSFRRAVPQFPLKDRLVRLLLRAGASLHTSTTAYEQQRFQGTTPIPSVPISDVFSSSGLQVYGLVMSYASPELADAQQWTKLHHYVWQDRISDITIISSDDSLDTSTLLSSTTTTASPTLSSTSSSSSSPTLSSTSTSLKSTKTISTTPLPMSLKDIQTMAKVSHPTYLLPIHVACERQNISAVQQLLAWAPVPIDAEMLARSISDYKGRFQQCESALFFDLFERILAEHSDQDVAEWGAMLEPAFYAAVEKSNATVIKALLPLVDLTQEDSRAFMKAWENQSTEILGLMLKKGIDINPLFPSLYKQINWIAYPKSFIALPSDRLDWSGRVIHNLNILFQHGLDLTMQQDTVEALCGSLHWTKSEHLFYLFNYIYKHPKTAEFYHSLIMVTLQRCMQELESEIPKKLQDPKNQSVHYEKHLLEHYIVPLFQQHQMEIE